MIPLISPPQSQWSATTTARSNASSTRNERQLNRDDLRRALEHLATLIAAYFPTPVRLLVHGGACMLLHPALQSTLNQHHPQSNHSASSPPTPYKPRVTTRDVDYIHRSFAAAWKSKGMKDATQRLQFCICETAKVFGLGMDWMNADPDPALPMAKE